MAKRLLNCKRCDVAPVRKSRDLETWLECPKCGAKGGECNRMSDDYAFTNSEDSWNRHVLYQN